MKEKTKFVRALGAVQLKQIVALLAAAKAEIRRRKRGDAKVTA